MTANPKVKGLYQLFHNNDSTKFGDTQTGFGHVTLVKQVSTPVLLYRIILVDKFGPCPQNEKIWGLLNIFKQYILPTEQPTSFERNCCHKLRDVIQPVKEI